MQVCSVKEYKVSLQTGYVAFFASVAGFTESPISKKLEVRK